MTVYKMRPVYKDYLWGGTALKDTYRKPSPYVKTAESWELASHAHGESTVCGGAEEGLTVAQLIHKHGAALLGDSLYHGEGTVMPLMIKLIDAADNLSVQVHPTEETIAKTEMWYVLDAAEDATLIYGFRETLTREQFECAIHDNTLEAVVNTVPCRTGDCFFIPAGMLHAIGKGLVIAEIQQNSDTTYRVYDYNRRDAAGQTRPLHIDEALAVTTLTATEGKAGALPVTCPYFTVEKLTVCGEKTQEIDPRRFEAYLVCEGTVQIDGVACTAGDTVLVPAHIGTVSLSGNAVLLRVYVTV